MKLSISGFVLALFCLFSIVHGQELDWEKDLLLSWDDFRAPPQENDPLLAASNCGITYSWKWDSDGLSTTVRCVFKKHTSWVKEEGETDHLLNHEQGHFNICEIFARKLRKAYSEYEGGMENLQENLDKIYDQIWNEYREMQILYDHETDHSRNLEQQEVWDEKIAQGMLTYEGFSLESLGQED